jgi:hypothetical protein
MLARDAMLLALDPGQVLAAQGLTPDAWQRDLLFSTERQVLLNCSRQSGKSTAVAALALHTALFVKGGLVLILSPSLRQSEELYRKIVAGYEALGRPVAARALSRTRLELENGARIVCLPATEETIRGFSGPRLLLIDEAARVPDDLYRSVRRMARRSGFFLESGQAGCLPSFSIVTIFSRSTCHSSVRPMLAVSHGRILCLSTPFGRRGFYYDEWTHGGEAWKRVSISAAECPRITAEFLERERQSLGESWVAQEYACSFEALEGLVYPEFAGQTDLACAAGSEEGRSLACAAGSEKNSLACAAGSEGQRVGGIDWGFRNPFAALWGCLDRDDVLTITGERYMRETPLHEHAKALPRDVTWCADPAGAQEINAFIRADLTVRKANNDIRAGIAAVHARLQTGRLKVVAERCPNLLAEAQLYRYPTKRDGCADTETPVDENNHALAALRYLVASVDAAFLAKFRRTSDGARDGPASSAGLGGLTPSARPTTKPWLRIDNEHLWR